MTTWPSAFTAFTTKRESALGNGRGSCLGVACLGVQFKVLCTYSVCILSARKKKFPSPLFLACWSKPLGREVPKRQAAAPLPRTAPHARLLRAPPPARRRGQRRDPSRAARGGARARGASAVPGLARAALPARDPKRWVSTGHFPLKRGPHPELQGGDAHRGCLVRSVAAQPQNCNNQLLLKAWQRSGMRLGRTPRVSSEVLQPEGIVVTLVGLRSQVLSGPRDRKSCCSPPEELIGVPALCH